jgi:serine/threonine protein kinase
VLHLDLKPDNIMMTHIGNHVKLIDLGYCYQDGFPFSTGGTLGYAAPEKEKTAASDIYSLGRIFSELGITGERIVDKCLRAEPFERYQSIDELVAALRKRHILRVALISILLVLLFGVGVWCWLDKRGTETMGKASVTVENLSESAIPKDTMSDMAISSTEPSTFPPGKTERDVPQPSQNDTNTFTAMEDRDVVSKEEDLLLRNQMKAFPLFEHVTDSILTELKQFVADDRMPYKLGGLEAYRLRYDSLKSKAIDCGKRSDKVPFWMHSHWTVYNGKPKPYNIFDNYLYQQMASIETLFQTHAVNYKLNQKFEQNDSSQP